MGVIDDVLIKMVEHTDNQKERAERKALCALPGTHKPKYDAFYRKPRLEIVLYAKTAVIKDIKFFMDNDDRRTKPIA